MFLGRSVALDEKSEANGERARCDATGSSSLSFLPLALLSYIALGCLAQVPSNPTESHQSILALHELPVAVPPDLRLAFSLASPSRACTFTTSKHTSAHLNPRFLLQPTALGPSRPRSARRLSVRRSPARSQHFQRR